MNTKVNEGLADGAGVDSCGGCDEVCAVPRCSDCPKKAGGVNSHPTNQENKHG